MGILDRLMGRDSNRSSERSGRSSGSSRSVVKYSKQPAKSGFLKHNAKKFIVMTKATAGNVKANVNFAIDHQQKHFAIEDRGYSRHGTYKPNSTDLAHAIARLKRDNYSVTTATGQNGYGETVVILFAKYGRPAKTTAKTVTVKRAAAPKKPSWYKKGVKTSQGVPVYLTVSGKRYKLAAIDRNKARADEDAESFRHDGEYTRVRGITTLYGSKVWVVYSAKRAQKKKRSPQYEFVD